MSKMRKFLLVALIIAVLALPGIALAGTQMVEATLGGETATLQLDTPTSYGFEACPDAFATDVIDLQGVPADWQIFGNVTIRSVHGGIISEIPITSTAQFPLTIDYGPVEDYALFQNPDTGQYLREVHVDMSIGFMKNGLYADFVVISDTDSDLSNTPIPALGPYNDWDVFCHDAPPPPPPGDEGCTPGYWKNHTDSWLPTGYSPSQMIASVFSAATAYPTLAGNTLLVALDGSGGPGATGAARILLRAATAAVLNASNPDVAYTRSAAAIIADVNAALASGDRDTMLTLATALDIDNNLGCPLN